MSRTDKDDPWWVKGPIYKKQHRHIGGACDLPPKPDARTNFLPDIVGDHCYWYPAWPDRRYHFGWVASHAPRWYINHIDTAPTRVKVRDSCIKARKEYRGSGYTDVEPPTNQHRHCAAWLYW